jgi:hypothetical protein
MGHVILQPPYAAAGGGGDDSLGPPPPSLPPTSSFSPSLFQFSSLLAPLLLSPGHEERYASSRQDRIRSGDNALIPPTISLVMRQAYRDLGLQVRGGGGHRAAGEGWVGWGGPWAAG